MSDWDDGRWDGFDMSKVAPKTKELAVTTVNGGSTAVISKCGKYRYLLTRATGLGPQAARMCFVMLNPSTADAFKDDPTIRRCIGFAKRHGHNLTIVNLFAYRSSHPDDLLKVDDPVGPLNPEIVEQEAGRADTVVAAWGGVLEVNALWKKVTPIIDVVRKFRMMCFGKTASGAPRHPLYVKGDTELIDWWKP